MDFDNAKENIQPLACGRNVQMLHASLRTDSHELQEKRKRLEQQIQEYAGDDPLEPWYHYIDWIEQSCPSGGKESGLQEVLVKCLTRFEKETQYCQDERMVKLYIKFISLLKEPLEKYEALYKSGIGTMVADFYISWAYVADLCGSSRKADEIFLLGLRCNAQPKEVLEEAHQHFRYYVGQRLMYKDDEEVQDEANRQLSARRLALASLRRRGKKATVGSIRTGAALKSQLPGVVQSSSSSTTSSSNVASASKVYTDENNDPNSLPAMPAAVEPENASAVRMLIDAARNQENEREPGPWQNKKHGKLFARQTKQSHLDFEIHEDSLSENKLSLPKVPITGFKYPTHFVSKNSPQANWIVPITTEEKAEASGLPEYNKCLLYPRPNKEFQLEELRLYYRYKRQGIANEFTKARDVYWSKGDVQAPMRLYPNFAVKNLPQKPDALDAYFQPPNINSLKICAKELYNADLQQEFQLEEIMWQKRQARLMNTQYADDAMEETMCANSERVKQRKSFFPAPNRKSIFPTVNEESPQKPEALPFEIYEDTTQPKMLVRANTHNDTPRFVDAENIDPMAFQFKAPLPPAPLPTETVDPSPPKPYFDADETCCTQNFNILRLTDKSSTPLVPKVMPRVVQEKPASPTSPEKTPPAQNVKHLSTILETSEHCSSHTTAASRTNTKSSCASNNELESTPAAARFQSKMQSVAEKVGDFSRLEQLENTATLCGVLGSLRLQEEKMVVNTVVKFQEDQTDTFSKLLKPPTMEDKTDTLCKLLTPMKIPATPTFKFHDSKIDNDSFMPTIGQTQAEVKELEPQNKHMLPDSFLKDFHMPAPSSFVNTSGLKFLNDTAKGGNQSSSKRDLLSFSNTSTIKFLNDKSPNKLSSFEGNLETAQFSINNDVIKNSTCLLPEPPVAQEFVMQQSMHIKEEPEEMSIYYKKTPRTPKETRHAWVSGIKTPQDNNEYVHEVINLDATHQVIQSECAGDTLNPFSAKLRAAFLDDIAFTEYIGSLGNCQLKRHVSRLQPRHELEIHNQKFYVIKLIGEGGFGSVYEGKQLAKGNKVALKQEQPPKLWEYYICLEIQSRIQVDDMLPAFMSIDWALIGSNSSILVYRFSMYGSLIEVCNKIRKITNKHLDEFVVMFLAREILEIIDHLHAVNIIHADIKPDNILLMEFLNYKNETRSLQLIDFGESIDMRLFQNSQQEFKYVYNNNEQKCVEMREGRSWTYQLDLYGVCGVIHALLFGKYMDIERKSNGTWMPKTKMPRYFHKDLWENIFETLLNIKESQTMPDLQNLRKALKEVLVSNEHQVQQRLTEFNFHLRC